MTMQLEIPKYEDVITRQDSGIAFGVFDSADNIKWAVRDHHARFVWAERAELKGRYSYAVKFVKRNGEYINREDDTLYRVMSDGTLELIS